MLQDAPARHGQWCAAEATAIPTVKRTSDGGPGVACRYHSKSDQALTAYRYL